MAQRLLLLVLFLLPARLAFAADDEDKARATALFKEAQALIEAGKLTEACPKFEESVKAHAGVGNQFNLADCWEKTGRTASAHALFVKVAELTKELGQADREKAALARAEALSPKLTRLRVDVAAANELELTRDGQVVARTDWGKPIPVDPGVHELRAAAPGKEPWTNKLEVPAEPGIVLVSVPALGDAKKAVAVVPPPAPAKKPAPKPAPPPEESNDGFRQALTLSLVGVGVAGLVVGGAMSAKYVASHEDAQSICPEGVGCTQEQVAKHDEIVNDARTARTWALVGFGAGAVALTGAAILHFTAPSQEERPKTAWVRPLVFASPDGTIGGVLRGGF